MSSSVDEAQELPLEDRPVPDLKEIRPHRHMPSEGCSLRYPHSTDREEAILVFEMDDSKKSK